jgi:hypothetical protein
VNWTQQDDYHIQSGDYVIDKAYVYGKPVYVASHVLGKKWDTIGSSMDVNDCKAMCEAHQRKEGRAA